MKRLLTLMLALVLAAPAAAEHYFYIAGHGIRAHQKFTNIHVSIYDPDTDISQIVPQTNLESDVWGASVAAGYGIRNIRGEIDLTLRTAADVNNAEIKSDSLTVNIYYDLNNRSRFTPFVGLGTGVSRVKLHIDNLDVSNAKYNLSSMGTAGVAVLISDSVHINIAYRMFWLGYAELSKTIEEDILSVRARTRASEFLMGAQYRF
jgi:opacity protein-like surface antigen